MAKAKQDKDEKAVFGAGEAEKEKNTGEQVTMSAEAFSQIMKQTSELTARLAALESRDNGGDETNIDILDVANQKKRYRVSFMEAEGETFIVLGLLKFTRANGDASYTTTRYEKGDTGEMANFTYLKVKLQKVGTNEVSEKEMRNTDFANSISQNEYEAEEIMKTPFDATPNSKERIESASFAENKKDSRYITRTTSGSLVKASARSHRLAARFLIDDVEYVLQEEALNMTSNA